MGRWAKVEMGLLATIALLAIVPATAAAATTITVNETTDAPLSVEGVAKKECIAEDVKEGCTLRAAVELANQVGGESTIEVPGETFKEELLGTLDVESGADVVIVGEGAGSTIIEGEKHGSVFEVNPTASLSLRGVTVQDGEGADGGGIYVSSLASTTIEGSAIEKNKAEKCGGGVYGEDGASITTKDSTIDGNEAAEGGGICAEEGTDVTVGEHSTIAENSASEAGGGIYGYESHVTVGEQSAVTENEAVEYGGGIYGDKSDVTVGEQSTITENHAEYGGGIYVDGSEATVGGKSTIEHNSARWDGGGMYGEYSELTVDPSTIAENSAEYGGGIYGYLGEVTVKGSAISRNTAAGDEDAGGGIYGASVTLTVSEQSTVNENKAEGGDGYGGGIYTYEAEGAVKASTVAKNTAGRDGGGIYGDASEITVEQSTITENTAEDQNGGGIVTDRERGYCSESPELIGELTVKQSTISDNAAGVEQEGNGGGIDAESYPYSYYCQESRAGSAARNAKPAAAAKRSSFTHRAKRAVVRGTLVAPAPEEGGGLTVEQSTIAGNTAGWDGGGIYERVVAEDAIFNSTIADNRAGFEGGGLYAGEDTLAELISDTFSDNATSEHIANNLGAGDGGEIRLRNTILAEEPGEHERNCSGEVGPLVHGAGYSLDYPSEEKNSEEDRCGLGKEDNDLVGVAPGLDPKGLQSNGGPTQTIALLAASPAIGYVPLADCVDPIGKTLTEDQRGESRPGIPGDGCDIGAYEYQHVAETAPEEKAPEKAAEKPAEKPATPAAEVLAIKIKAPAQCTSKRDITIHIQNVKRLGIVSAVISIDGHARKTLKGKSLATAINLAGLPKGTFTVEIVALRRNGRTVRGKRVYHTCRPTPLPGHSYLPL